MNKKSWPTLIAVIGATAVCATAITNAAERELVTVRLTTAPQNAGKIAQATLVPQGGATAIELFISGVPSSVAQPPNLYTYIYSGTCGSLGAKPVVEMNQYVALGDYASYRGTQMAKLAPIALSQLRSGDYALVVRTSPADGYVDIFCGNLKQAA
jgi:hypothetical protein